MSIAQMATWMELLRAPLGTPLSEFDEQGLLDRLELSERAAVDATLAQERASRIASIGWLGLPFFVLLARVDLARLATGEFARFWVFPVLAVTHLMLGVGALPALLVAWRRRRDPTIVSPRLQRLHLLLVCGGLLAMGLLGILQRQSAFEFTIALFMVNLIYHVPHRLRLLVNVIAGCLALGIVIQQGAPSLPAAMIRTNEVLIVAVLATLVGGSNHRQRIRSIIVEGRLEALSLMDALTGTASRRRVEEVLAVELRALVPSRPLALIMVDIDHFKSVNDTFGHNAGDEVLRGVARVLRDGHRAIDLVGRWGGEEFVILCVDTPLAAALELADRVRGQIAAADFGRIGTITASFGVAMAVDGDTPLGLVERADAAMYSAKRHGRNRVHRHDAADAWHLTLDTTRQAIS